MTDLSGNPTYTAEIVCELHRVAWTGRGPAPVCEYCEEDEALANLDCDDYGVHPTPPPSPELEARGEALHQQRMARVRSHSSYPHSVVDFF